MTSYETIYNPNPKINELEHLLKNDPRVHQKKAYKQALELKLQAIKQEPSPIEKTMTEEQLYNANNPLWANNYSVFDLECYFQIAPHPSWAAATSFIKQIRAITPAISF